MSEAVSEVWWVVLLPPLAVILVFAATRGSTGHGTVTPTPKCPPWPKLPAGIGTVTTYHDGHAPSPWPKPPSKTRCTPGPCPASSSCSASLGGES